MTLTTDIYWEVNGTPLHTLAYNIETLEGRLRVGEKRGEDVMIPYAEGDRFTPKVVGPRVITLAMWVRGMDEDGNVPANRQAKFEENYMKLMGLFFQPRKQLTIQKRIWVGGSLRTVVAQGQYQEGLDISMIGRYAGRFLVDIKLNYPWFLDTTYQTFNLVDGHQNVTIPGIFDATRIMVVFNGSRTNPQITNWTTEDDLKYTGSLVTSSRVEIDIPNFQAWYYPPTGSAQNHEVLIDHSGDAPMWFMGQPGVNDIELQSTSGTGTVQLQVKGAWP